MAEQTNTIGWDTVFAIPVKYVNEAIRLQKSSPTEFGFRAGDGECIKGSFEDWQIAYDGDGPLLWLTVPCRTMTYEGNLGGMTWADVDLTIQVQLRFIPAPDDPSDDPKVKRLNLVVKWEDPKNPVIALISAKSKSKPTGEAVTFFGGADLATSMMKEMIREWLNRNLQEFAHVFAVVDLNLDLEKDARWAWAKPSDTGYAYQKGTSLDDSIFGVMCMTGGRKADVQQAPQVDKYAIPPGAEGAYLVQQKRFLEDLLLPSLPKKYTNSTINDYEVVPGGDPETGQYTHRGRLKDERRIKLTDVQHDGSTYTPYLTQYEITMEDMMLTINSRTETDVGWGVTAWCTTIHRYTIGLDPKSQTLKYEEQGDPVVEHGSESKNSWVEKALAIFAAVILTVILGLLTEGAGFVVGALIIGLVTGAAGDTQEIVAAVNSNTSPDVNALITEVFGPIQWPISQEFTLTSAELLGPLRLGGILHFNTT